MKKVADEQTNEAQETVVPDDSSEECEIEEIDIEISDGQDELVDALQKERDEYKDALIRERADFENFKKRNAMVASESYQNGIAEAACKILPVLDNFERACAVETADKQYAEGMELIMRQLQDTLKTFGVEEIDASGEFDPQLHDAVMQVEQEGCKPNHVAEVLQKGYCIGEKVLRHSMVKVAK